VILSSLKISIPIHYGYQKLAFRFKGAIVETNEMIDKLKSLIRLDNDALNSYNKVIEVIDEPALKTEITRFRDDHKRHVSVLSELVKSYGGVTSTQGKDIRGLFLGVELQLCNQFLE